MGNQVILDLPDELLRRIEQIAAVNQTTPADVALLALEAACTPDGRKLQRLYTLCHKVDEAILGAPNTDCP